MSRDRRSGAPARPRRRRTGGPALLAAAWIVALVLAGCAVSGPAITAPSSGEVVQPDQSAAGTDDTTDLGPDSSDDLGTEPPPLAPVASSARAKPACDAAFKAWVDWWQASALAPEPSDPDATPTDYPPGDPYELERIAFENCSVEDMAIANARHPVTLDPEESPVPYIDYEVRAFIADTCEIDADVIGDTALCQGLPGQGP